MKRTLSLLLVASIAGVLIGCSGEEAAQASDVTSSVPAKKGGGGADLGSAELQPGISAAEADARVGSALKSKDK